MSFRYINPGYSRLTNYQYNSDYCRDYINSAISRTGVAYYNTSSAVNKYQLNLPKNDEYWVKFDFYYSGFSESLIIQEDISISGIAIYTNSKTLATIYCYSSGNKSTLILEADKSLTGLKMNAINSIWLHIKWGSAGVGFLEFQINNKKFAKIQDKNFSKPSTFRLGMAYNSSGYFSSVIISDEEISPYEELVRLPVASTITDMSARDGGGYIASDTSQTLLQAVDTTALVEKYGSDAKVTIIALVGNPAYEVDEVLGKLTSISKRGNAITEHETIQLSASQKSIITSSFAMQSDTTIAGLSNLQFGWKASE